MVEVETTVKRNKWLEALFGKDYKGLKSGMAWSSLAARLLLGFVFLWGGLGKMAVWSTGKMATAGFLTNVKPSVPLAGFFNGLSGNWTVEYLVVFGELLIGVSLILGLFTRVGCIAGIMQMALFALAIWPSNPLIDMRILYGGFFLMLFFVAPGRFLGVDGLFEKVLPEKLSKLKWMLG